MKNEITESLNKESRFLTDFRVWDRHCLVFAVVRTATRCCWLLIPVGAISTQWQWHDLAYPWPCSSRRVIQISHNRSVSRLWRHQLCYPCDGNITQFFNKVQYPYLSVLLALKYKQLTPCIQLERRWHRIQWASHYVTSFTVRIHSSGAHIKAALPAQGCPVTLLHKHANYCTINQIIKMLVLW